MEITNRSVKPQEGFAMVHSGPTQGWEWPRAVGGLISEARSSACPVAGAAQTLVFLVRPAEGWLLC